MAKRRDWDRVQRETKAWLHGRMPHWQDGWTSEVASTPDKKDDGIITFVFPPSGILLGFQGRPRRVHRIELILTGISYFARRYITLPFKSCPKPADVSSPAFQAQMDSRIDHMFQRLHEKAHLHQASFQDGVIKEIFQEGSPERPSIAAIAAYLEQRGIGYKPNVSLSKQLKDHLATINPQWKPKQLKQEVRQLIRQVLKDPTRSSAERANELLRGNRVECVG